MLSIDYIRKNQDKVKSSLLGRKLDVSILDKLLESDKRRVELIEKVDGINRQRNEISHKLKSVRDEKLIETGKNLKKQKESLDKELSLIEEEYNNLMLWIPNVFKDEVPDGSEEKDNIETYAWSPEIKSFDKSKLGKDNKSSQYMPKYSSHSDNHNFELRDHVELGEINDIIDINQSAKVSGSRFSYIKKEGVLLQWAIVSHLSKKLIEEGFYPLNPPLLVKERSLYGTSHFPQEKDQVYSVEDSKVEDNNKLYLVGSSEPSNFSYFMDKILDEYELPQMVFANTTCFRTEVGSWGKDVRGIKRVHQFDKLEMDVVSTPDQSDKIFKKLLDINKWFWESLEIPFHIILKCKGDSGYYASAIQSDIEAWLPSQNTFIEVGTCTNATDFQARRLNIKYRDENGKLNYVHTVNDTGAPLGRSLIAILENYQQEDGSILVPKVLREYTGFDKIKRF
jgi:seryl-tRNA synthetase